MLFEAASGRIIIATLCTAFYFGVTRLVRLAANVFDEQISAWPEERGRIQELLDDGLRGEMIQMLEAENAEADKSRRQG